VRMGDFICALDREKSGITLTGLGVTREIL